jgi:anti-sigma factor RsiW
MHCDCDRFIQEYSEYRDGVLTPDREAEFREHVAACPCCARYDRVLRAAGELLAQMPCAEPDEDFMPRLQHRLYNIDEGLGDMPANRFAGAAALVGVAAVGILALFWLPFAAAVPMEMQLDPVAAYVPPPAAEEVPSLFRRGHFVDSPASQVRILESGAVIWQPRTHVHPTVTLESDSWIQASASFGH